MSLVYVEGDLLFEFGGRWMSIVSWDRHAAYQEGIKRIDKGKAVDIIGVCDNKLVVFIEIKDYRLHKRTKSESLWAEFELKVRNTVAGLLGAGRRVQYAETFAPYLNALLKPHILRLILWVERPLHSDALDVHRKRHNIGTGAAMRKVAEYMKWLDARVINVSQEDYERWVPELKVKNLAYKRRELAEAVVKTLLGRGIKVGEPAQRRISEHRDIEELESWLARAATASTAEELFGDRR
jgi:hypothetical protein